LIDCVKFKDLVLEKDFVSIIEESVFDISRQSMVLCWGYDWLTLALTKTYIDKLLVKEKRVKYIEGFESLPS